MFDKKLLTQKHANSMTRFPFIGDRWPN